MVQLFTEVRAAAHHCSLRGYYLEERHNIDAGLCRRRVSTHPHSHSLSICRAKDVSPLGFGTRAFWGFEKRLSSETVR
jgi:hypothetical protein